MAGEAFDEMGDTEAGDKDLGDTEAGLGLLLLTHHVGGRAFREGIQVTHNAIHQTAHAMFISPSDVGRDDQVRQMHLQQQVLSGRWFDRKHVERHRQGDRLTGRRPQLVH